MCVRYLVLHRTSWKLRSGIKRKTWYDPSSCTKSHSNSRYLHEYQAGALAMQTRIYLHYDPPRKSRASVSNSNSTLSFTAIIESFIRLMSARILAFLLRSGSCFRHPPRRFSDASVSGSATPDTIAAAATVLHISSIWVGTSAPDTCHDGRSYCSLVDEPQCRCRGCALEGSSRCTASTLTRIIMRFRFCSSEPCKRDTTSARDDRDLSSRSCAYHHGGCVLVQIVSFRSGVLRRA